MFRTLSMSRSHGLLPDFFDSSPASFLSSTPSIDDMEERQREREKQKLLNMSIDYSSYSPISSFDKPTNFSRPNQNSAFDGLYVPYGSNVWDDPWAIKKEKQEMINELPPIQPELIKQPSQPINPFATDVAPSLVFPYDVQQVSPASILSDQPSPTPSLMMSDSSEEDDMMIQAHKRQRGEHHTIYVQQQPQDQDMISTMDVTPYTQPSLLTQPSQTGFVDFTANVNPQHITINNHYTVNNNNNNNINDSFLFTPCPMPVPFTLQPQAVTLPHLAPISIPESTLAPSPSSSSSRRSSMYDSDGEEDVKRKRKAPSTKRNKSLPVATHVIENTGAPVKMAKFLQVDGLTTCVWIEHAIFTDNGITTDIRMIMYQGLFNGVVVHAGDVGERIVCNRRSNISREFGQYTSPVEKILVRVPSEHRPLGQTGNVLTAHGLIRFLQSKKMRKNEHQVYRRWLLHHVYSIMQQRPFTFPEGHALETKTVPDTPFTEDQFSH